ncbi:hypothetical protein [Echinicola shivajiensis]|uniref:hypothetical protein n=1 Tax=Echinicola shivajiensis TaxID=1035916 RepID=UPI001BFC40C8|nr:hypothetical protein [Echinicola shivajiensis]
MKTFITFLLLISILQITVQTVDIDKLKSAFSKLEKRNNLTNQRTFFELFPNSFDAFEQTFGYKNGKAAPLYDGHEYVVKFFSLDSIPEHEQMNKWINISIGGHWEADAINYFQYQLRPRILKNTNLTYELLKKRSEKDTEAFFYFFFNQVHPEFEKVPNEFESIKKLDNEFYSLILKGYQRAIKDSGH